MPKNLELKARSHSITESHERAKSAGAAFAGELHQTDKYFRVAEGRLKLREIQGQGAELIAYKRPDTDDERISAYTKTPVEEPAVLGEMLAGVLGMLVRVKKVRWLYLLEGSRIHLDEVEELGSFLEFEVPVRDEERATATMATLRALFGVTGTDIVRESYSDLLIRKKQGGKT